MLRDLAKIGICISMGASFGWFVGNEWAKYHPAPVMVVETGLKPVCTKPILTARKSVDIKIVNWK